MCMCLKDHLDAQERKQDKSTLETPIDFEEEVLDAEVQANEAIPLSDEEIALDAASSEGSMSGPGSGGEEAEVEPNYVVFHDALRALVDMWLVAMLIKDASLVAMLLLSVMPLGACAVSNLVDNYTLTVLSQVMSTLAYVDSETITHADGAQSSRVPVRLPDDPYVAVRQAQLVDTDTKSEPEEAPSEAEESQPLGSRVPLMGEEFEASEPSGTRIISSYTLASSDSTTPLSPDHPLTHVSPTPTPTRASFYRRTTCMTVHAQPAMFPGYSARVAKAMALSDSPFRKRYRSSYETPSPSPSPSSTLPVRKRYRGTSELILDTDSEGDELGDEDTEEDKEDESLDADDERERVRGPSIEEEEEATPKGQQQAVPVTDTAA
ncbi:hypothetical protein Tco_1010710, partial [Tanacetum coccineum]